MNYKPIPFEKFKKEVLKKPDALARYEELEEEFALFAELIKARKIAHKTQREVAEKMQTSQAMVARIENSFNDKNHSPTLRTIRKYAKAVGCRLSVKLIPEKKYQLM